MNPTQNRTQGDDITFQIPFTYSDTSNVPDSDINEITVIMNCNGSDKFPLTKTAGQVTYVSAGLYQVAIKKDDTINFSPGLLIAKVALNLRPSSFFATGIIENVTLTICNILAFPNNKTL